MLFQYDLLARLIRLWLELVKRMGQPASDTHQKVQTEIKKNDKEPKYITFNEAN